MSAYLIFMYMASSRNALVRKCGDPIYCKLCSYILLYLFGRITKFSGKYFKHFLEIWDVLRCIFTIKEDKQTFWRVVKSYICCGGNVWYWFSALTNRANFKREPVFISGRYICETFIKNNTGINLNDKLKQ